MVKIEDPHDYLLQQFTLSYRFMSKDVNLPDDTVEQVNLTVR